MDGWMRGWMDGWMDMDGMDVWMVGYMDRCMMSGCIHRVYMHHSK